MKFSTDTYISQVLASKRLRCGGGKNCHYMIEYAIAPDAEGLLAIGAGTLHFRSASDSAVAALALGSVGIATTPADHRLTFSSVAATQVARGKWLGQRQGFTV